MNKPETVIKLRKLSQKSAYTAIQLHELIGRKTGLEGTDHKYLGFFVQKGTMTAGELANLTGLTTGAVTGLTDRLERKKLVKRQRDTTDRRKVLIVPDTDKIIALLQPLYKDFQAGTDKLFESFTLDELNIVEMYLLNYLNLMKETINRLNEK